MKWELNVWGNCTIVQILKYQKNHILEKGKKGEKKKEKRKVLWEAETGN